jgi:hypothetical protein
MPNELVTTMAVTKTEASAAADKLVATTRGRQTGTENDQLKQWQACHGIGGAVVAQRPHGSIVGARGVCGHDAVLVGWRTSWWQQQEGGRQSKTTINLGSDGHAAALAVQRQRNTLTMALLGQEGGSGRTAVLVGRGQGISGSEE